MSTPTYMDYSATTPVDKRVAEQMIKHLTMDGDFGNPASNSHYYGWKADEAVKKADDARNSVTTDGLRESDGHRRD